jgi:predicted alpha/beta superfamily hydrolase
MVPPSAAHLERFFDVGDANASPRMVRVWVPAGTATHVLYVQDGQNLFDPDAPWGGWQLQSTVPAAMMLVGIDNTAARMDEYTHVTDDIGGVVGGGGDDYADFVHVTVRALIAAHYGEPATVGLMGSSLGGLISYHIALRYPGSYDFAASLSGTMGWGSIGLQNETMIERYDAAGHSATALYLDSGGNGTCYDSDGDGIEDDDPSASDNYCENLQLQSVLLANGYTQGVDLWHWWETDAQHNEAAWAARVWRPMDDFSQL